MAQAASYADPLVGAITVRLDVPSADFDGIRADSVNKDGFHERLASYAWQVAPGLLSHEWAHIMQVSAYPLLLLRAARQGRLIPGMITAIAGLEVPAGLPAVLRLDDDWHFSSLIETLPIRLHAADQGIRMEAVETLDPRRGTLRELDLVEEDATIFQYRVEIGSPGTGPGYRRWLIERPRYSAIFSFLTDFMTDDQALQLIPVICRVCFATIRPLESLAVILSDLVQFGADTFTSDYAYDEWDATAEDLFRDRLRGRYPIASAESVDFRLSAMHDAQGLITAEQHARIAEVSPHLVASLLAQWSQDDNGLLTAVLRHPWQFFERRGRGWDTRLDRYAPPVTVYDLRAAEDRQLIVIATSEAMKQQRAPVFLGADIGLPTLLLETLRRKYLVDAALGQSPPVPECPHTHCRFHRTLLCRGWFPIPADAAACDFPEWFGDNAGLTVTDDGQWLIKREQDND